MDIFVGRISSSGFTSGDRIVIGDWKDSCLGEFTNIMWAKPDGKRILLSPSKEHGEYVSSIYDFEEIKIVDFDVVRSRNEIAVSAGELKINMKWKIGILLPFWRPLWFIATVEKMLGNLFFGSKTQGITKNGRKEWYSVRSISRVIQASAQINGESLGNKEDFSIDACFGFSEPPSKPSSINLKTYIE